MVIDAHTHISHRLGIEHPPERLLASMDAAGIDASVLIANDIFNTTGVIEGPTTEQVIEVCARHPRLYAVGSVEVEKFTPLRLEQFGSYIRKRSICGVKVYAGYDVAPADVRLHPLYDLCEREGVPVIFHTGFLWSDARGLAEHAMPLGVDAVAQQFPKMKIVLAHFGNPWIVDCAVVVMKNSNVYVDLSGYFSETVPINQLQIDHLHADLKQWSYIVGGYDRCLFGTDYPLYNQRDYLRAIRTLSMGDAEWERVLWKNASELFGITEHATG